MEELLQKHGGYKKLKSFQLARLIYDITVRFCAKFIDKYSRTNDQMVQAARSGVQNIAEGSQASATSKKTELKLTGVARSSLEELLLDYQDFLRQKRFSTWQKFDPIRQKVLQERFQNADQFALWAKRLAESQGTNIAEIAANGVIVLIEVTCRLLSKQIAAQADDFQKKGGFTERLYRVRTEQKKMDRMD